MLQDSLALSYTLSNQYEEARWKYQDAEDLLQAVLLREKHERASKRYARTMTSAGKVAGKDKKDKSRSVSGIVAEEDEEGSLTEDGDENDKKLSGTGDGNGEEEKDGEELNADDAE